MKKLITIFLILTTTILIAVTSYNLIKYFHNKSQISKLEKYTFVSNEKIIKEFKNNNRKFIITKYYDKTSSWSHLNILLKEKNNYYKIENINKCDTTDEGNNIYINNNKIYIHCIGKKGDILEYKINNLNIKKETLNLNYDNTPNISQLHIAIDKVDNNYIYLSSSTTIDSKIKEGNKVKCSFKENKCSYY